MKNTFVGEGNFAALRLRISGSEIDRYGTNIHQLGRALMSSQELINVAASHKIRCDYPIEKYTSSSIIPVRYRVFFIQGHLGAASKGSLDLLINLINQPELRAFLQDENSRAFGISVLANLFTHAALILTGRWKEEIKQSDNSSNADNSLAVQLAPFLEKLSRTITPKGGIGHIEMSAEDQFGSRVELRVDRHSRDRVLEFADVAPAREIDIVGEIRSVDLDSQSLVVVHPATGERIEVEFSPDARKPESFLRQMVYIRGRIRPRLNRWGAVSTRTEAITIQTLAEMQQ